MKYRTETKKEDILKAIVEMFHEANAGYSNHLSDTYYLGRYMAMWDLLAKVKIFEEEE